MTHTNSNRILCCYISILLVILIHFFLLFHSETPAKETTSEFIFNPHSEYWPTKDWKTSTPERQGMNSELLAEMFRNINNNNIDIYSILIVRNGYIVTEANKKGPNYMYHIASCTKSFTSAVFGIALGKGYIKNIDQKITDFFPEILKGDIGSKKASITLRHLLTMSSGLEWPEHDTDYSNPENPAYQMYMSNNWAEFILNKPLIQEPGSVFNYNSGCSYLLMAVLDKVGLDVKDFAQKNLFTPLGISIAQYFWRKDKPYNGIPNGCSGLKMRLRDMAKFGYLYLKGGFWDGQQIIPKAWVEESTKGQVTCKVGSFDGNYGYQWWVLPSGFVALGYKGQYIAISPEHELVVVFTSNLIGSKISIPSNLGRTNIIPAIQSLMPLPENEKAITKLKSEIDRFEIVRGKF